MLAENEEDLFEHLPPSSTVYPTTGFSDKTAGLLCMRLYKDSPLILPNFPDKHRACRGGFYYR